MHARISRNRTAVIKATLDVNRQQRAYRYEIKRRTVDAKRREFKLFSKLHFAEERVAEAEEKLNQAGSYYKENVEGKADISEEEVTRMMIEEGRLRLVVKARDEEMAELHAEILEKEDLLEGGEEMALSQQVLIDELQKRLLEERKWLFESLSVKKEKRESIAGIEERQAGLRSGSGRRKGRWASI